MWKYDKNVAEQRGEVAWRRTERKITDAEPIREIPHHCAATGDSGLRD